MIPLPIRPTRFSVSSPRRYPRSDLGRWYASSATRWRNCSPALRSALSIMPSAHSATG
jgi:hypothetical protein